MHPLLHLIAKRPQLLADHAEAYVGLVADELPRVSNAWKRKAVLFAMAMVGLLVGLTLIGVALMLSVVNPGLELTASWPLIAVPLIPILAGLVCFVAAQSDSGRPAFDDLRVQVKADVAMLREAAAA
mgnify:CR=1 FL=1